jgi:hypothetical protein
MAKPNKPLKLMFCSAVRIRGEHLVGENSVTKDGRPNMVIVKRGEVREVRTDAENFTAHDLVISKQAIDLGRATQAEIEEVKQINADYEKYVQSLEKQNLKKAA